MVIHNPKVGGSIPPPATNFFNHFNNLEASADFEQNSGAHFCCKLFRFSAFPSHAIFKKPERF